MCLKTHLVIARLFRKKTFSGKTSVVSTNDERNCGRHALVRCPPHFCEIETTVETWHDIDPLLSVFEPKQV